MRAALRPFSAPQERLFAEAEAVLGFPLGALLDEGPLEELTRTENAQPALLVVDLAFAHAVAARGRRADVVLGHSVGEWAALVWAGVVAFADAVRLVRRRGRLMQAAAEARPGGMCAVVRVPEEALRRVVADCAALGVLEISNVNAPGQLVLSGETAALEEARRRITEERLGRAVPLQVAAPFHSSLMAEAAEGFGAELAGVSLQPPRVTFVDNVTGRSEADPERIRQKLATQLVKPVRWSDGVRTAAELGGRRFVECGPGRVLCGLVKRVCREAGVRDVTVEPAETLLATEAGQVRTVGGDDQRQGPGGGR